MKFKLDTFNRDVPEEELLQDLVAADAKVKTRGGRLTFRAYNELGKFSATTIATRFGSWNDGLRKAGLALTEGKNIPVESLFDNLKIVWIAKGRQPTTRDLKVSPSCYTYSSYNARFGSWRKALEAFVASVEQEESESVGCETEVKRSAPAMKNHRNPSLVLRFRVLKRDNFRCVACGRSPATVAGLELEVDHVFPWSKGGNTLENNLQTLCFECNRGKGIT